MQDNTYKDTQEILELTQKSHFFYQEVLKSVRNNDLDKMQDYLEKADYYLLKANQIHAHLLKSNPQLDLLIVYGEDCLISLQVYKAMIKEFIDLYKKLSSLK